MQGILGLYSHQLANNYLNEKGVDVSQVIRGRLFAVQDIMSLPDTIDNKDKLEKELKALEAEGFTAEREPQNLKVVTPGGN